MAEEERHSALAVLGRARPVQAAELLSASLDERSARLQAQFEEISRGQVAGTDRAAMDALLEEIDFILQCTAHLLADRADGGDSVEAPPEIATAGPPAGAPQDVFFFFFKGQTKKKQ